MLGIGGGGDVVGSLALARRCEQLGTPFVLGGVAWERLPVDPVPGPRPLSQVVGGDPLGGHAVLAGPDTATPEGVRFSEAHVAAHLGAPTVLIDITDGPDGAADGIGSAAGRLGCDLVVYADIGGDAIAAGTEPGLGSPLCDAVMLAAGLRVETRLDAVMAVIGAGCDGELELDEVLGRIATLAAAGAWIGSSSVDPATADEIEAAAAATATEASMQVVHCARGVTGTAEIRGGRRRVPLGPVGALAFCFDLVTAAAELPLASAVLTAESLDAAHQALRELGISTELDYELERAGQG
ncbi:MAG: hypothetical protein K0R88_2531 [Solirubrobacterales bacterium]|nr:hypothetical protein [Solirubrobacterales bacterium]